jgi:hypothetical protein
MGLLIEIGNGDHHEILLAKSKSLDHHPASQRAAIGPLISILPPLWRNEMKKMIAALFVILAVPFAAHADDDLRKECEQYAIEENVPPEERAQYIRECMGEPQAGTQDEEPSQPSE